MTSTNVKLTERLSHVHWLAGGTGAGKTTITRLIAERHDITVYCGDTRARRWRFTPDRHPYFWALTQMTNEERSARSAEEAFRTMPSLHGETIGLIVEDLLALPSDRPVLVDNFGVTPHDLVPLLRHPSQALFLLPTTEFRLQALGARFADPERRRVNWGDGDHGRAFQERLARDELWVAEMRRQLDETDLPSITQDGSRTAEELAVEVAQRFWG